MRQSFEPVERGSSPFGQEVSDLDVRKYLSMALRHWRLLVLFAMVGAAFGIADFFNTPPTYQATTRIQIQRRNLSPLGSQSFWLETWWQAEFYPTQREILKSRGLAQEVVKYLRLWEDPRFGGALNEASSAPRSGSGVVTAAEDEAVIGRLAQRVSGGLDVREVRNTELFDIVYRDGDAHIAQMLANAYAETFIEYGKQTRRSDVANVQGSIESEIARLEAAIAEKDEQLIQYKESSDIVETGDSTVTQQRLQSANDAYVTAQERRIRAQSEYNEIVNRPPESVAETLDGGTIADLRGQLNAKEREYTTRLETYKPEYPGMPELQQEIAQLREQMDREVGETVQRAVAEKRAEYQAALQAEQSSLARYRATEADVRRLDSSSSAYRSLLSEIALDRELLESLRRSQGQTSVAANNSDRSTVIQIDPALLPSGPISPNLKRNIGLGLTLGLAVALGIAFLRELLDRTLKTPEEIEQQLGLPVLSVIPDLRRGSRYGYGYGYGYIAEYYGKKRGKRKRPSNEEQSVDLIAHKKPRLPVSEAYRGLRTSLLLSKADGLHSVVVASATASEGKTATAANLAVVMAQLGRRVLLIDADLRRPRVHKVFRLSNRTGLVSHLVGLSELEEAIQPTEVENLAVMTAGPIPPNPSELLSSPRMAELLESARSHFDLVVLDTPPALAVTDAILLADTADGLVLCVRAGRVSRDDAKACRDRLELAGISILGTVLNCFRANQSSRYQRTYAYLYQSQLEDQRADDAA